MDLYDCVIKIGHVLKRLVAEHGAPNTFACSEVALLVGVSPMQIGKAMRTRYAIDVVAGRACLEGRLSFNGRFVVKD